MGHDVEAAGTMGAIRHKRAIAADRLSPPREVMTRLDRVLQQFGTTDLTP